MYMYTYVKIYDIYIYNIHYVHIIMIYCKFIFVFILVFRVISICIKIYVYVYVYNICFAPLVEHWWVVLRWFGIVSCYVWKLPTKVVARQCHYRRARHDQCLGGSLVQPVIPTGPQRDTTKSRIWTDLNWEIIDGDLAQKVESSRRGADKIFLEEVFFFEWKTFYQKKGFRMFFTL